MAEYQKQVIPLVSKGMMTNISQDIMPDGFFPFLQNIRIDVEGILQSRPRLDIIGNLNPTTSDLIHSIKKLVDKSANLTSYIVGAGSKLYAGPLSIPGLVETGFSGEPLSIIEFRPEESISSYLYLSDRLKFRRIGVDNMPHPVGIEPPNQAVGVKIDKPKRKILDNVENATLADWVLGGLANTKTLQSRVNTTITKILIDNLVPGWCSIIPASFVQISDGVILNLSATEDVVVEDIKKSVLNTGVCTISSISYDLGVTGRCVIDLSIKVENLELDSILLLNGTEYVRVLDILRGPNNSTSVIVNTIGTFVVGNTVSGVSSFRSYINLNHADTDVITGNVINFDISGAGIGTVTKTANFDLSFADDKGLNLEDFLHFSLWAEDVSDIEEIQFQLDVDGVTNDFTRNWFSYGIRPNDLLGASELTEATLTNIQQVVNRVNIEREFYTGNIFEQILQFRDRLDVNEQEVINDYTEPQPTQLATGDSQWNEFKIPLNKFLRNGTDLSKTLKDVKAIRISVKALGNTDFRFDSLWIGGGFDVDSRQDNLVFPYRYMARYRESGTKTISNWGPINRVGIDNHRNRVLLTTPVSLDLRVDKIDYARIGGANNEFRIIGSKDNDADEFVDDISDVQARDNPFALRYTDSENIGDRDYFKPFALLDKPKTGFCNVVGNKLTVISGDLLNTNYAQGTRILVNDKLVRFYTNPSDTLNVELEESLGTLNNVPYEIKDPLLTGQPLPVIFGPIGLGQHGLIIFGLGDLNAAGTVYWLDGNSPDTMSDTNKLEITPSSEPLIGGVIYDGFGFVWTSRRSFTLYPSIDNRGRLGFQARENANSVGLASKDTIVVGSDAIYYLRRDLTGIDKVQGNGNPLSITNDSLSNLFVQNGKVPENYIPFSNLTIEAMDIDRLSEFTLHYCNSLIYFRYYDTNGDLVTLVYDTKSNRWICKDSYVSSIVGGFYEEDVEGDYKTLVGVFGQIASFLNQTVYEVNNPTTPRSIVLIPDRNQGSNRFQKDYREIVVDAINPLVANEIVYLNLSYDNNETDLILDQSFILNQLTTSRSLHIYNINNGIKARSLSTHLYWNLSSYVKLYNIEYNFIPKPERINLRPTDLDDAQEFGNKFFQGVTIRTDTRGINKLIQIYDEEGNLRDTITINHNGETTKSYAFTLPFVTHSVRLIPVDDTKLFENMIYRLVFDKEPEFAKIWEGQPNGLRLPNLRQIKRVTLDLKSSAIVNLKISIDNSAYDTYTIPSTVGIRKEIPIFVQAKKGKLFKFRLDSVNDFQLYRTNCKVFVSDLTLPNGYQIVNPFGDDSNLTDVRI
jgi:hypothetical protein